MWGHLGRNFVTFLPNEKNVTISNWLNALKIPKSFQSDLTPYDDKMFSDQVQKFALSIKADRKTNE